LGHSPCSSSLSPFNFRDLLRKQRNNLVHVGHDPELRDSKDRSPCILVDRYDEGRALNSAQMLKRAADSQGNIDLGFHFDAGCPYLMVFGQDILVHDGTLARQHTSHSVSQSLEKFHIGLVADPSAE